jgi:hypothetical protein
MQKSKLIATAAWVAIVLAEPGALAPTVGPAGIFPYIGSMVVGLGMPALVFALSKRAR